MANKKVLYVSYNGLLEPLLSSQVIPYLKGLVKKEYEFVLLTYEKKSDLERIGKTGLLRLRDKLKQDGIEWRHLRYHKAPRLLATLFDLFMGVLYCSYLIQARGIRLVHVRGATPGSIMLFVSKPFGVKLLFDMRGRLAEEMAAGGLWNKGSLMFRMVKYAERSLLKKADAVTVLTKRHLELIQGLDYLKKRRIFMDAIPCCVDMERFRIDPAGEKKLREDLGLGNRFVLMYQGKIGTFYFLSEMLDFYKETLRTFKDAVFFVLTPDDERQILEKAREKQIPASSIMVKKGLPFSEMPRYMSIADAGIFFINPHDKLGSSPIKMGEFLACGVPVVINPGVGDTEELVRKEKAGVVVTDFDKVNYQKAMQELSELMRDREVLRKRCRDAARKHLALEDGIAAYLKIYEELTQG